MKKINATKYALLGSIISIFLCCLMFVGTTFAWLTDSVTSEDNRIETGNLAIDLQKYDEKEGKYLSIANQEGAIFSDKENSIKWEPGKTEIVYLKVKNSGNLALKFDFLLTVSDGGLVGALDYALIKDARFDFEFNSWEAVKKAVSAERVHRLEQGVHKVYESEVLKARSSEHEEDIRYVALAVHMDEDADNKYQGQTVTIDASVFATQVSVEKDSFGDDYDSSATYNYSTYRDGENFEEFWSNTKEGDTIYLQKNSAANDKAISLGLDLFDRNVTIDAAGNKLEFPKGITIAEGKKIAIKNAKMNGVNVRGDGKLELWSVTIDAVDKGTHALTIEQSKVNLVIKGYTVLTAGVGGDAIHVGEKASLELTGSGKLVAIGNGGSEDKTKGTGGSGIGGAGDIYIHDMANLTAEGYGRAGFGIGGASKNITIKNTNMPYVKGGFVQKDFVEDEKYGKSEPEGGCAIGSMTDGAKIILESVIIDLAEGGSKSAGIGARYHTAVSVSIKNSTIKKVIGGNASAGIGGSRIRQDAPESQTIVIDIIDSVIVAEGGQYGAGIGSGYDTHCSSNSPICTINIKGSSDITAKGGTYAAGIGTGYHAGGLAGTIEKTVKVNAKSGEKNYKDSYSKAQDVGFGVVDPAREGQTAVKCSFNYKGQVIAFTLGN